MKTDDVPRRTIRALAVLAVLVGAGSASAATITNPAALPATVSPALAAEILASNPSPAMSQALLDKASVFEVVEPNVDFLIDPPLALATTTATACHGPVRRKVIVGYSTTVYLGWRMAVIDNWCYSRTRIVSSGGTEQSDEGQRFAYCWTNEHVSKGWYTLYWQQLVQNKGVLRLYTPFGCNSAGQTVTARIFIKSPGHPKGLKDPHPLYNFG